MAIDNMLGAVNAYRNQMKMMEKATKPSTEEAQDSPFAQMLTHALEGATDTLKTAEATEMQAVTGKVELTDLVTAVASAELSLSTVVAVRDRVIGAYNDIIRMAI
ncbi:MAG: flagellar hook-basal body complex protein FliE [Proteobacteria bacterium]|nr:flagellar hook-basal body complex protein FliE [Pseudomonadota bacterium]